MPHITSMPLNSESITTSNTLYINILRITTKPRSKTGRNALQNSPKRIVKRSETHCKTARFAMTPLLYDFTTTPKRQNHSTNSIQHT